MSKMKHEEAVKIIENCFAKQKLIPPKALDFSEMTLEDIDFCTDCVADILILEGFEADWEPNEYGLKLEDAIDFLLQFRYSFEDKANGTAKKARS